MSFLGSLLREGTQMGSGYLQGKQQKQQDQADMQRQMVEAALERQYKQSQIDENNARTQVLQRPPAVALGAPVQTSTGLHNRDPFSGDLTPIQDPSGSGQAQPWQAPSNPTQADQVFTRRQAVLDAAGVKGPERDAIASSDGMFTKWYESRHPEQAGSDNTSWQTMTLDDGRVMQINPKDGTIRPATMEGEQFVDTPKASKPNVTEMSAYMNYPSLEAATGTIIESLQANPDIINNPALLVGSGGIRGAGARLFMNEDEQIFGAAVDRVLATLIYIKSGKQVTVQEARRLAGGYIPAFADKNASSQQKVSALLDEVENMRPIYEGARSFYERQSGQSPQGTPQPSTPTNPYR